jgi:DNA repair protein RecN (Recombination protein N)
MLTDLHIRHFAIIERLHVSFRDGFNVLTGETGAGKSIIIDAVALILGGRASPDMVRTGESEAIVEAVFDLSDKPLLRRELAESGFGDEEDLLVKRIVNPTGRNKIFINGSLAKLSQLQPLTSRLMNIYGQHEHQSLQRVEHHLAMLDRFAGLSEEVASYGRVFEQVQKQVGHLQALEEAEQQRRERLEHLEYQQRELAAASLRSGEEEELLAERRLMQNSERLVRVAERGYETFYASEGAISEQLDTIAGELEKLSEVDSFLSGPAEELRNALYVLEDVAFKLREYAGRVAFDPGRQAEVERRLDVISGLKRKYGMSAGEILDHAATIEEQIDDLLHADARREDLQKKLAVDQEALRRKAQDISTRRYEAAERLRGAVEEQLADLAMQRATFEMRLFPLEEPGPLGMERGEFYLAPNAGETAKPLAWIASGGELSRIMLALRRAAPGGDEISTLIFDEVDAGVGGVAASAIGAKLRDIAAQAQVLCVTHLPQVAACADHHYRVQKQEKDGRTFTELIALHGEQRVEEMARMLGGAQVTERTMEHAREIIEQSVAAQPEEG